MVVIDRCYLKLGDWTENTQGLSEASIPQVLQYYHTATQHDKSWYKVSGHSHLNSQGYKCYRSVSATFLTAFINHNCIYQLSLTVYMCLVFVHVPCVCTCALCLYMCLVFASTRRFTSFSVTENKYWSIVWRTA